MNFPRSLLFVSALTLSGMWVSGCGGKSEAPQSPTVITPASAKPETADQPAGGTSDVASSTAEPAATSDTKPSSNSDTVVASAANAPSAEPAATGVTTFKGRIVVKGTVPEPQPIIPSGNDQYCIALGTIPSEDVVVGEGGGLANVFVWAHKIPAGVEVPPPPTEPAVLDQKDCRFIPRALVAQVGQPLIVKNDDATAHNTRITGLSVSFNSIVGPNNRTGVEVDFTRAERVPLPVNCDVHNWMSCRVLLTDNPWHAVTDENGYFEIKDLPAGKLEFRLQHEKAGYIERSLALTFEDGQTIERTFEVDAAKLKN